MLCIFYKVPFLTWVILGSFENKQYRELLSNIMYSHFAVTESGLNSYLDILAV